MNLGWVAVTKLSFVAATGSASAMALMLDYKSGARTPPEPNNSRGAEFSQIVIGVKGWERGN